MTHIYGIVPPATTPFNANGDVDLPLLANDLRYLIEQAGVHGIAVGGSTGEGHTLSTDEMRQIAGAAVRRPRAGCPSSPASSSTARAGRREGPRAGRPGRRRAPGHAGALPVQPRRRCHDRATSRSVADRPGKPVMIYNVVPWAYCSPDC